MDRMEHRVLVTKLMDSFKLDLEEIKETERLEMEQFKAKLLVLNKNKVLVPCKNITEDSSSSLIQKDVELDGCILMYMMDKFKDAATVIPLEYTINKRMGLTQGLINCKSETKNLILFPVHLSFNHYSLFIYSKDKNYLEYFDSFKN